MKALIFLFYFEHLTLNVSDCNCIQIVAAPRIPNLQDIDYLNLIFFAYIRNHLSHCHIQDLDFNDLSISCYVTIFCMMSLF